jgi:hypothetical protein
MSKVNIYFIRESLFLIFNFFLVADALYSLLQTCDCACTLLYLQYCRLLLRFAFISSVRCHIAMSSVICRTVWRLDSLVQNHGLALCPAICMMRTVVLCSGKYVCFNLSPIFC